MADALTVPIAAGEYHYGIEPFRYMLERRSIDIVMIDLMRVGGLTRWMKVAHLGRDVQHSSRESPCAGVPLPRHGRDSQRHLHRIHAVVSAALQGAAHESRTVS